MKQLLSLLFSGVVAVVFAPSVAVAGECTSGFCGTPDQSGGGCGCGCGCGSILVAMTDRGDTYQFADDQDGDGFEDDFDNCPFSANVDQLDQDGDGVGDSCDLCAATADAIQSDLDGDGLGDAGNWNGDGETCDTQECYTFARDGSSCLAPDSAFDIALLVPRSLELLTGERVDIQMFTNRLGALHNWTARFEQIPDGSAVSLFNAQGSATTFERNQVSSCLRQADDGSCEEFNTIAFTPDEPGQYIVKVTANLPAGDDLGPNTATALAVAEVGGDSQGGGCAAGGAAGLAGLALALFGLGLRRRRRA